MEKETEKKEKILVRMTNWVGDCLIGIPALGVLREKNPKAKIIVLVKEAFAPLFEQNPFIDGVIPFKQKSGLSVWKNTFELKRLLERESFDSVYIFPRSWSSVLAPYLAKIPKRVGYANQGRGILFTEKVKRTKSIRQKHQAAYYVHLIDPTVQLTRKEMHAELVLTPEEENWAQTFLEKHFNGNKILGIAPGATYGSAKMWGVDRYRELCEKVLKETDLKIAFFGGIQEAQWMGELAAGFTGAISFAGQTSLRESAALMKCCQLVLSNDSGPMHLAAAVNAPLVVLFGPTNYQNTYPLGEHQLIQKKVACSPCMLRHCPIDHRCMNRIEVDEVFQAILKEAQK